MSITPESIENPERYNCFIVFEPASLRIHDQDILCIGEDVFDFFNKIYEPVQFAQKNISEEIMYNRLSKFSQMLDMVQQRKQVVITHFFDRIWRRYAYVSHLGEALISLEELLHYFPKFKKDSSIIADRFLASSDDFDEDDGPID